MQPATNQRIYQRPISVLPRWRFAVTGLVLLGVLLGGLLSPFSSATVFAQGAESQPSGTTVITVTDNASSIIGGIGCSILLFTSGCLANFTYYFIFSPVAWFAALIGTLFNLVVAYSLSSEVFNSPFVKSGWSFVRDIANIAFIFILLYIGIATILRLGSFKTKTLLANLIIAALLINFSFFFTRVVIDAGNIAGLLLYNQTPEVTLRDATTNKILPSAMVANIKVRRLSDAFVAGINPQQLISKESFDNAKIQNETAANLMFALVSLSAAVVAGVVAYAFFAAGILFVIRVPVLWFITIMAPIAFVAWILPQSQRIAKRWWTMLFNQAIVAAIFLFFLTLILGLADSVDLLEIGSSPATGTGGSPLPSAGEFGGSFDLVVQIMFKMSILVALLLVAVRVTKATAQAGGIAASSYINKVGKFTKGALAMGITGGAAGAGFALRRSVGRYAYGRANDKEFRDRKSKSFLGRMHLRATDFASKSQFNVKSPKAVRGVLGKFGIKTKAPTVGRGGFEARQKELAKRQQKFTEKLSPEGREEYARKVLAREKEGEIKPRRTIFSAMAGTTKARQELAEKLTRGSRKKALRKEKQVLGGSVRFRGLKLGEKSDNLKSALSRMRKQLPTSQNTTTIKRLENELREAQERQQQFEKENVTEGGVGFGKDFNFTEKTRQELKQFRVRENKISEMLTDIDKRNKEDEKESRKTKEEREKRIDERLKKADEKDASNKDIGK